MGMPLLPTLAILGTLLAAPPPSVSAIDPPRGTEALGVHWMKIAAPGQGVMLAAVALPERTGPAPAVILLHGAHGFTPEYVNLAKLLSRGGVIAVAPCWFSGGGGTGARVVSAPIACPEAQRMPDASSAAARSTIDALVQATQSLPLVRRNRIALVGHSRGAVAALQYVLRETSVQAVVLDSSAYPDGLDVSRINVPILILHGTADAPSNAGSPVTAVQRARAFEAALRRAGKTVEASYYERAGHNGIFTDPAQRDDEVRRMVEFFRIYLAPP